MRIKTTILPFTALLALTVITANAGPGSFGKGGRHAGLPPALAEFDKDGDGKLSEEERAALKAAMEAKKQAILDKYDTNKDGVLSAEERAAAKADREAEIKAERTAKFATIDKDGDGKVTLAEFQAAHANAVAARVEAMFKHLDANNDGSISLEEFLATPKPGVGPGRGHGGRPGRR